MRRLIVLLAVFAATAAACGCGEAGSGSSGGPRQARVELRQARRHARAVARHRAVRRARFAAQREQRAEAHRLLAEERQAEAEVAEEEAAAEEAPAEESSECDPNYAGACLDPTASDYDCAGGSGNGPEYTGTVTVVGEDHFGLDADGDGIGCEG